MSDYTQKFTTEDLAKEMALVKITHALTGKVPDETMDFLLTAAISLDLAVRKQEATEAAHAKLTLDLQTESFSKDIEIQELREQIAELRANA